MDTKAEFLAAAGKALKFPAWAGRNWDAFEELVNDLSWLPPAQGYLLLFERASRLAGKESQTLAVALEILELASQGRLKDGSPPLVVLVRGAGRVAAGLPLVTGSLQNNRAMGKTIRPARPPGDQSPGSQAAPAEAG